VNTTEFAGFPADIAEFFADLTANNNKTWFDAHRQEYLDYVKQPAEAFADAMTERLVEIAAGPPPRSWIFRINRDIRFSKDKTPYKTHVGIAFGDPAGKKDESPGFYFHFEPPTVFVGAGMHTFPKPVLERYRETVGDEAEGARLTAVLDEVRAAGPYEVWGETYKRVPQGFPSDHTHAELLRYGGLFAGLTLTDPPGMYTADLLELCVKHYQATAPIQRWLAQIMGR